MPLYIDIHELPGITPEQLAQAHAADVATQQKYGVSYQKYWVNHDCGKVFCMIDAPDAEAARRVHLEAHGFVADKIVEVQPEVAEAFLGSGVTDAHGAVLSSSGGAAAFDTAVRTILFTDMVESTSLTQRLGDERALELLRLHDAIVREAISAERGREIKRTGDGIMAAFASAAGAVRCASQIQAEFARRDSADLKVRIGGAAGEPVGHANDIFGTTVQLAARLCAHAAPEEILVTNVVAELCVGKRINFRSLGELALKGFDQPVAVHAVDWQRAPALAV